MTPSPVGRIRVGVVVPAAGEGRRMGGLRKPFLTLRGEPLLLHSLRTLLDHPRVTAVRVALAPDDAAEPPAWLASLDGRLEVVAGGFTRATSVQAALAALPGVNLVLVHDGARPLVSRAIVDRCLAVAAQGQGAVAGWPATDTLKEVDDGGLVVATPDRRRLWHAQTPQAFPAALIRSAYQAWDGSETTDDAALVEGIGGTVIMVEGSPTNLKVTRPEDLAVAESLLAMGSPATRKHDRKERRSGGGHRSSRS